MTNKQDEKRLVDDLKHKKSAAFEKLVNQYSQYMYITSYQLLSNEADSKDCVQKAFVQVLNHIDSFKSEASLKTWLHRITINCALMMLRSNKRQSIERLEGFEQHYNHYGERTVFTDNANTNIEYIVNQQALQLSIQEWIQRLPEKFCNLIQLRDIQGISTKETAHILQISEGAVKTQLHRARLCLKALFEHAGIQP